MQFGEFIFPFNPNKIEVSNNNNILKNTSALGSAYIDIVGKKPTEILCHGEFVGDNASTHYQNLLALCSSGYRGVLSLPYHQPFYAVINKLRFIGKARENSINYYIEFLERISDYE